MMIKSRFIIAVFIICLVTNLSTKSNYRLSISDERMWDCPLDVKANVANRINLSPIHL
jgi:hypothetical protein